MCWNASVSINTYIFSTFACIFAYMNGIISIPTLLFYQSFMCMQLIEYFIWSKTFSNRTLSQIAYAAIVLQPIFALLCIEDYRLRNICLVLYTIFVVPAFLTRWSNIDFRSIPGANGHLAWYWANFSLPILITWTFFLTLRIIVNRDWLSYIIVVGLLFITYILYNKTNTWGTLWCWLVNMLSFYLIYKVFAKEFCKP